MGHLPALLVTPANEQERHQVYELAEQIQEDAAEHRIRLEVIKLPQAEKGFVLLPGRWVVERSFGWRAGFRRPARDYERLPHILEGLHFIAFIILMLKRIVTLIAQSASQSFMPFRGTRNHEKMALLLLPSAHLINFSE